MNRLVAALVLLAAPALPLASTAFAAPASKPRAKPKPAPEVLVVADAPGTLDERFVPTKEKPVYYIFLGIAERNLGTPWAGEPLPEKKALEAELERTLASQHFVRTKIGGPIPQLALVVSWGSASLDIDEISDTNDAGETVTSDLVWNRRELADLVGAYKVRDKLLLSTEADALNDAARQDRLYLMIGAFDALALVKKQKILLWRTRISIESRRTSLPESLAVMLDSAAPYYGRNSDVPIFVDDNLRKKADVRIGTPVVVPEPPAKK